MIKAMHSQQKKATTALAFAALVIPAAAVAQKAQPNPANQAPVFTLSRLKQMLGGSIYHITGTPVVLPHGPLGPDNIKNARLYAFAQRMAQLSDGKNYPNYSAMHAALAHLNMKPGPWHAQFHGPSVPQIGVMGAPAPANSAYWSLVGPRLLPEPYQWGFGPGPMIGRVNGAAFDSNNPGTYYIASASGGAWKTTDGGNSWQPLSDKWPTLFTTSVAVDPVNSAVYVGTGDDYDGPMPDGLMKSTDMGNTWTQEGGGVFGGNVVNHILIDPSNHNTIFVATGIPSTGGLYRSADGGNTWTDVIPNGVFLDVEAGIPNASGTRMMYAAAGDGAGNYGLYISSNDGLTWTLLNTSFGTSTIGVAPSAVNPDTVYVYDYGTQTIWKSTDDGSTWTDIGGTLEANGGAWSQGWYDYYIKCTMASGRDELFVGLLDIWQYLGQKNATGQPVWNSVLATYTGADLAHTDQHGMTIDPSDPAHMLIGNDGGVYSLKVRYFDYTTQDLNPGLAITQYYGATANPAQAGWVLAGAQDNGTSTSNVGGPGYTDPGRWSGVVGGDGFYNGIDTVNPAVQYGTVYNNDVVQTTNYWLSSQDISPKLGSGEPSPFFTPLYVDPNSGQYAYTCTNHLYQYNLISGNWTEFKQQLSSGGYVDAVAVPRGNSNIIYTGATDGQLWMSTDGGSSWNEIDNNVFSNISDIKVVPGTTNQILVGGDGSGGHVFLCTNTTATVPSFINVSGSGPNTLPNLHVNTVAVNPANPTQDYYAGNQAGLYYTLDGGMNWFNLASTSNLPNADVSQIHAQPGKGALAGSVLVTVCTYGRGVWQTSLNTLPVLNSIAPATASAGSGPVTIQLYGINFESGDIAEWNGNALQTSFDSAGQLTATIPASYLANPVVARISVFDPTLNISTKYFYFRVTQKVLTPQLTVTFASDMRLSDGTVQVVLNITDTGTAPVQNLADPIAALNGWWRLSSSLGATSLAPAQSTTLTLVFPRREMTGPGNLFLLLTSSAGVSFERLNFNIP